MRIRGSTILRSNLIKPPLGLHGGNDMMMRPTRVKQRKPSHHQSGRNSPKEINNLSNSIQAHSLPHPS